MNTYKVTCYSKCNSYFRGYLQSVVVMAKDEVEALDIVKKWLKEKNKEFIYPEYEWKIYQMSVNVHLATVIDYCFDSDY